MGLLKVSAPPHIRIKNDTREIMLDVIIALMPAMIAGGYFFGYRSILVVLTCVISAIAFEHLWCMMLKKESSVSDLSAVVSGVLLGLNLPATIPFWMAISGSFFMIIIVKMCFGGLGQNFLNPALAARAFLVASWPSEMTNFVDVGTKLGFFNNIDAVTSATPLSIVKQGAGNVPSYIELFLGFSGGCIGEVSVLALLIGGIYLLIRKVIDWRIPVSTLATVAVISLIAGRDPLYDILAGGLVLGAIFMATDYTTSPITSKGHIVYGIGCGLLTSVIRIWGGYPEGVSYAILLMNIATPLIEKFTQPRRFGKRGAVNA